MRGVDLFCGCGGLSLGFSNAGIKIAVAYDNWSEALACYRANFNHSAYAADLTNVSNISAKISQFSPDIIIGGPPCQDFSSAGKREEKDRANLTTSFAKIIDIIKPKWFVMENVSRARTSKTYQIARRIFKNSGYGLTEETLNACHYGVPQNRLRFFCIGLVGAEDGFLSHELLLEKKEVPVTIREYFRSINVPINIDNYYRHPRSYKRRAVFSVDEPSPTIRGVNRPVPGGYNGHNGDKNTAKKTRPLSTQERALIQTFPLGFNLPSGKTAAEQLLGNAVPVRLAEHVANSVIKYNNMHCNMLALPTRKGSKARKENIGGISRSSFMLWMENAKHNKKYAKDMWSWLSQAESYFDMGIKYADKRELIYQFERGVFSLQDSPSSVSRMKKSLGYFWSIRQSLNNAGKELPNAPSLGMPLLKNALPISNARS